RERREREEEPSPSSSLCDQDRVGGRRRSGKAAAAVAKGPGCGGGGGQGVRQRRRSGKAAAKGPGSSGGGGQGARQRRRSGKAAAAVAKGPGCSGGSGQGARLRRLWWPRCQAAAGRESPARRTLSSFFSLLLAETKGGNKQQQRQCWASRGVPCAEDPVLLLLSSASSGQGGNGLRQGVCIRVECRDMVEREKGGSFAGTMEVDRTDGRTPNQLRPLACTRSLLHRAHGSAQWSQGETIVLAAVYGPKVGIRKGENPEKASIEVVWKPKTGQIGKAEKEYEMILRRTLQSICLLTVHPNTTTSVILQVVSDDGALLPCAINASCAALVDAGIPLKHLAVAVSCGLTENGSFFLDPSRAEEQVIKFCQWT
ncbi:hypothetical protein Taro_030594, partial [Colocasia esculenta]|nr:hypothetical protein [Colocasia esculenta]